MLGIEIQNINKTFFKKHLIVLFLFSLILRLIFTLFIYNYPERLMEPDSYRYLALAEKLLDSFKFPSIFRTPGYPFFITLIYAFVGKLQQAVVISQCILDSITTIFIMLISLRIYTNKIFSLTAGFLYAINPFAIFYSYMVLTETIFTFTFVISMYFFISFIQTGSKKQLAMSSILIGVSVLIRPAGLYLPLLLTIFIFIFKSDVRQKLINSFVFLGIFYVMVLPWYLRNYYEYDYWTFSTIKDITIFYYEAPSALIVKENPLFLLLLDLNKPLIEKQEYLKEKIKNKYGFDESVFKIKCDIDKMKILKKEGEKIIKENITQVFFMHLAGTVKTLFPYYPHFDKLLGRNILPLKIISLLIDVMTTLLAFIGSLSMITCLKICKINRIIILFLLLVIFYFSFLPGCMAYARYRVPVIPYISILASLGIVHIKENYA